MKRYFKLMINTCNEPYEDFVVFDSNDFESEEELEKEIKSLELIFKDSVSEYYEELTKEEFEEYYEAHFREY